MVPPEDMSPDARELSWRLQAVEASFVEMRKHFDTRLDAVVSRIEALQFVPRGEYEIQHTNLDKRVTNVAEVLAEKVEATRTIAMWALGLVATTVIGAVITAMLATGFGK